MPDGRVSVTRVLRLSPGPLLLTVRFQIKGSRSETVALLAALVMLRSSRGRAVVRSVTLLLLAWVSGSLASTSTVLM